MPTLTVPLTEAEHGTSYAGVYHTVFLIPRAEVAELLKREYNASRVIYSINGEGEIQAGMMNDGQGDFFITVSKEIRKKYRIDIGDAVTLELRPDNSAYGIPVPAEVAELWDLDPESHAVFHQLTPGNQRNLLYQIDKLKRPDSRAKKCVQFHDYLKAVHGNLDYRELNAWIKADNR